MKYCPPHISLPLACSLHSLALVKVMLPRIHQCLEVGLQGLAKPSSRQHSGGVADDMLNGSIPAGRNASSGSVTMERAASQGSNAPLVLNGVLSLANAGTWLQMLRSKLASNSPDWRRSDFADAPDTRDGTVSEIGLPAQQEEEEFGYAAPMRRSRSDALHDRNFSSIACRRGSELARASSAGMFVAEELVANCNRSHMHLISCCPSSQPIFTTPSSHQSDLWLLPGPVLYSWFCLTPPELMTIWAACVLHLCIAASCSQKSCSCS